MYKLSLVEFRSRLLLALAMIVAALGLLPGRAELLATQKTPGPEALSDSSLQQKWQEGLAALGTGRFKDAFSLIHEVAEKEPAHGQVGQVNQWLADFEKLQQDRADRTRKSYETYVSWVQADSANEKWLSAIRSASMAFNAAPDQEAFRSEPWLLKVVEGAGGAAREYEEHGKWLQAARIYVRLADMFPRKKEYKDALERCQAHIRLDFTFAPDADWETEVAGISAEMAHDAFSKIAAEYITPPSFKAAAVAALKHVLLMTEEAKIGRVFKRLENKETVEEFRERVGARLKDAQESDDLGENDLVNHFDRVLRINRETQLFPQTVLIHEFVYGALRPLDPFSDMLWPADLQEFNKHTQGHFSGVGISIHKETGEPIMVVSPLEDSPAYNAGIQPGDMITCVNRQSTKKMTISKAINEITGTPGSTVTLTIKRPGVDQEFDVKLERQEITIFTIKGYQRDQDGKWGYMVDPASKVAYMRMTNFTDGTIDELKDVIRKLCRDDGMRGLIFDLRGNPGGTLKAAVDVCDLFLDGHKKIVATKDRHEKLWETSSSTGSAAHFANFPMIVLVNEASASASEIVAGALQVHGRALIVGERSFGKGSVQQVLRLGTTPAFLKLTTAKYYLPNGRCLHRDDDSTTWGVDPDVEVKLVPKEMVKAIELRLGSDVIKGKNQASLSKDEIKSITALRTATRPASKPDAGEDEEDENLGEEEEWTDTQRPDLNDYPEIDPQLDAALLLMRIRLTTDQPWPLNTQEVAAAKQSASDTH